MVSNENVQVLVSKTDYTHILRKTNITKLYACIITTLFTVCLLILSS